jgi:hypothetical protein
MGTLVRAAAVLAVLGICLLASAGCCGGVVPVHVRVVTGAEGNFELVPAGTAGSQPGEPLDGVTVRAWAGEAGAFSEQAASVVTGADGAYLPNALPVRFGALQCGRAVSFSCAKAGYGTVEGTFHAAAIVPEVLVHMAPTGDAGKTALFGAGALKGLKAGAGYVYRVMVDKGYRQPAGWPPETGSVTHYVRVLVTEVQERAGMVAARGRLDEVDDHGKLLHGDLFHFSLAAREDGSGARVTMSAPAPGADVRALVQGVPCILLGYPTFGSVPKLGPARPIVVNDAAGAIVARFTPTYDADAGKLELSLERFRYAYEDDAAKGLRTLYWIEDAQQLAAEAPAGREAAPMYVPGVGWPRQRYGDPGKYSVWPVVASEWETQSWEAGSPFPKLVRVSAPEAGGGYVARLLTVQQLVPMPGLPDMFMDRGYARNEDGETPLAPGSAVSDLAVTRNQEPETRN